LDSGGELFPGYLKFKKALHAGCFLSIYYPGSYLKLVLIRHLLSHLLLEGGEDYYIAKDFSV